MKGEAVILDTFRLKLALDALALDPDVRETIDHLIEVKEEFLNLDEESADIIELQTVVDEQRTKLERARQFYREVRAEWKGPWPEKWTTNNKTRSASSAKRT